MATQMLWHGLDYTAAAVVIKLYGHTGKKAQAIFDDLQVMERAALPILNTKKG